MFKQKIQVGHYYEFVFNNTKTIAFAVLYGFERGKNKDIYTVRMFTAKKDFEFPIDQHTFDAWVSQGRIKEITADELLTYVI